MRSLLTLSLLLAGCMATAQTITRKAILTKGQRFEQSSAATIDFEMNIMGSIERTQNSGTSTVLITVDKVLDTSYLLKTKLTHKIERAKSSAKNYEFDSGQPANTEHPEEWDRFIKEVGVEKEVIISKRGYSPPGTKRTGNMADAMGILSELKPGDDSNKTNKNYHMVAYLPANRVVKVGDTWADSATSGKSREVTHFTLTALTATEGVISVVETIDTDSDLEGEGNMKIKLKGTSNATITFNSQTGIVKKREDVMSASGTFVMQGFNIPLTMKATNVTTFTSMQP